MRVLIQSLQIAIFFCTLPVMADICASKSSQLNQSPRLKTVKSLFHSSSTVSYVNQTQGSFFVLDARENRFSFTFYTSGLFDLYGIRKDGLVMFCDNGKSLVMVGIGRKEDLVISQESIQIGTGGPKQTFAPGEMPELLKKLHNQGSREVAADTNH